MSQVVPVPDRDMDAFVRIVAGAYPGTKIHSAEERQKYRERLLQSQRDDPATQFYGLYRDGELLGGMRLFDFRLNLHGVQMLAGGVGLVAVDLLHKKEHVAKELIEFFVRQYHERGAPMTMLYPFRPDFYRQMGYGYGSKLNRYRIKPAHLPRGSREHIVALGPEDASDVFACYTRFFERTHGMIARIELMFQNMLSNGEIRAFGVRRDGRIRGYVTFSFKSVSPDNFMLNDLHVHELVYEDREALAELVAFLQSQADQVHTIVLSTHDDFIPHLVHDPRDGSNINLNLHHDTNAQGIGLMYRVSDVPRLFEQLHDHSFNNHSGTLRVTLTDSFFPQNAGSTTIRFDRGRPAVIDDDPGAIELRTDVSDFSSLLVGAVPFRRLYAYGRADISDPGAIDLVSRVFAVDETPICMTRF